MQATIDEEKQKVNEIISMSDEDIDKSELSAFGMSASYLKKFEQVDPISTIKETKKPTLILQGEKDKQVTMLDFKLWQEGLTDVADITFQSYPKLNHLMGEFSGEEVPLAELVTVEYDQKMPVSEEVINDIIDWLNNYSSSNK